MLEQVVASEEVLLFGQLLELLLPLRGPVVSAAHHSEMGISCRRHLELGSSSAFVLDQSQLTEALKLMVLFDHFHDADEVEFATVDHPVRLLLLSPGSFLDDLVSQVHEIVQVVVILEEGSLL